MNARIATRHPWGALGRMGIVAGMHVALVFVVAGALVIKKAEIPNVMLGSVIDEPETVIDPVRTIDPPILEPKIHVPLPVNPEFETDMENPPDVIGAQVLPPDGVTDPRGSADPVPVIESVRLDPHRPLTQPAYPPSELRAGNEGTADIEVYVLPNGRVGDARIVRGTGHERLDQAALQEARKNWRLMPATRDGVPFAQWHRLRVVFRLTKG